MSEHSPLTPQPEENLRRLERLAEDSRRLFSQRQPITAALMVALTREIDGIMARDPANEPEERTLAIHAIAEAMVRKAARGDSAAFAQIVDRIEGKVGTRKGDADEDVERHRTTVQATIEGVVAAMTRRRIEHAVEVGALPAPLEQQPDPQPVVVSIDAEPIELQSESPNN